MSWLNFVFQGCLHVHPTESVTPAQVEITTLRNQLPKSTGDNRYTDEMVPGYTGTAVKLGTKLNLIVIYKTLYIQENFYVSYNSNKNIYGSELQARNNDLQYNVSLFQLLKVLFEIVSKTLV